MKWIEVIQLRAVGSNRKLLKSQLEKLTDEMDRNTKGQAFKTYRRVRIDTDFSIQLFHDSKKVKNSGSNLGLRLVSALKEFGLVNHSIWIEIPNS